MQIALVGDSAGRRILSLGALFGLLGVALGAFGAHGLRSTLSPEMLAVFETGVRYQMYHAFALLATGLALASATGRSRTALAASAWCFTAGTVSFSGSLYVVSITGSLWPGAITPFGGLLFLLGWGLLAYAGLRKDYRAADTHR